MNVSEVRKDPANLSMTVVSEFDAPVDKVWQVWADPRKLERWWGPPSHPATFVDHDFNAGGRAAYYMTSPEGEKYHGWWEFIAVDEPKRIELRDGFADSDGNPNPDLPVGTMVMTLTADGNRTRMELETRFASAEAMEQTLAMGAEEGMLEALSQIDALL
jgi:uncharacterized protein YndB with AHSA1/START domain